MPTISTYNDNTIPDDGSKTAANQVKFATIKTDLTDPLHSWITNNGFERGADIASAAALNVNIEGVQHDVTGTTTITSIATATGTTPKIKVLQFDGALVVTQSSAIGLPGGENITTQAGDVGVFYEVGNGNWKCAAFTGENGHFNNIVANSATVSGAVGIGGAVTFGDNATLDNGVIFIKEQADADADSAGYGQVWVDTQTPNKLYFTDDAGTDQNISNAAAVPSHSNILAFHKGLVVTNGSDVNAQLDIDATEILVEDSSSNVIKLSSVNLTADIGASGANGLDTGVEGSSTWYYAWVIYDESAGTTASLLSESSSAPTLPGSYTYKGLVGAVFNDGSSNFLGITQYGAEAFLDVPIRDYSTAITATAATPTLTVPPNTWARFMVRAADTGTQYALITATDQTNSAPTSTLFHLIATASSQHPVAEFIRRADSSSQIRVRGDGTFTNTDIFTQGWRFQ